MRIALVSQSYYPRPGGVTEHVHHSALELRRLGHDVTVVTSNFDNSRQTEPGIVRLGKNVLVPIYGAWANMTVGTNLARDLKRVFNDLEPDVIHTHCPMAPTLPLLTLLTAPKNCRVLGTFHAAADRSFGHWAFGHFFRRVARRIDTRIAVSNAARALANKYVPGDFTIIPNGVDCTRFSPERKPIDEFCDDAFNILYVGRLDQRKGLKYLFHAMSSVAKSTTRRIRLIIVGDNTPRRHLLPRLPKRIELHFAGVVPKDLLPRYFATGHVFCSPATDHESFGIVLLEAMASGTPIIATSIPGYLTILEDRRNSLTVPPKDSKSLAAALSELINDEELRMALSENGRTFAESYHWTSIARRLEQVYDTGLTEELASRPDRESVLQIQKA